jgi:invasion protein IalB
VLLTGASRRCNVAATNWSDAIVSALKMPAQNLRRIETARLRTLAVLAAAGVMLFAGTASFAQPAAVPTPTLRPTAGAQGQQSGGAAAQGNTGQAAAPTPKPIITKNQTFGDWIFTCVKQQQSDAKSQCSIAQQLSDSNTKAPLFLWRIIAGDKGLVGEWQTRTGIMVDRGLVLDAGTDKPVTIPFQLCTPTGCQAVANLAPDFIQKLVKATKASATVYPIGQQGIQLTLSVKGLPDALAALQKPQG